MIEESESAGVDAVALAGAARLFGDLLLRELDGDSVAALREPAALGLLEQLGVDVPDATGPAMLDELAAEYHATFLAPTGGGAPPVASLWTEGRFEGDVAARVRQLAEAAALDFGRDAARGAPVDHLGVLLHLWAACHDRSPWVSEEIARDHLAWAEAPLGQAAKRGGFYGNVAEATQRLVRVLEAFRLEV